MNKLLEDQLKSSTLSSTKNLFQMIVEAQRSVLQALSYSAELPENLVARAVLYEVGMSLVDDLEKLSGSMTNMSDHSDEQVRELYHILKTLMGPKCAAYREDISAAYDNRMPDESAQLEDCGMIHMGTGQECILPRGHEGEHLAEVGGLFSREAAAGRDM